jgi:hypothetical protein
MASNYHLFDIKIDNNDGTLTPVPNQTVQVYDVTNGVALAPTSSDAFGVVPGAAVDVDAGTLLRFSVARADGLNGFDEQETT